MGMCPPDTAAHAIETKEGYSMAFKIPQKSSVSIKDPESLFRDLRDRTVEGLLAQQADILRNYMDHVNKRDIALELPTGSGKTLVGLLIAEWRRRTKQERCVLLCPTKQLVHQVVEQAKEKYGINALDFSGSKHQYLEADKTAFINCESIGVATYSALFNTNPFFSDVSTLIFDDAHAAENYVSSFWSFEVLRNQDAPIFEAIWKVIEPDVAENDQRRYDQDNERSFDASYVNKVPTPHLIKRKTALTVAIESFSDTDNWSEKYKFRWQMIKDHLHACHLYYTSNSILIRPLISPTKSFPPFEGAKQRIYMSATLGEAGDLERAFGRRKIKRISAPDGWDKQGIGRRLFMFPMRNRDESDSLVLALSWTAKFDRTLILTPSKLDADKVRAAVETYPKTQQSTLFDAKQIEASKKLFIQKKSAIAVLENRYDGIDLIGEECRYLIIYGFPESTNLQERFIISRLGASILFDVRIRTRITQAVGRCTRSSTDYALVVIIGEKAHAYFHRPEKRQALHPELQAEVDFGIDQSKSESNSELEENIDLFVEHGREWKEADDHILETRDGLTQKPVPSAECLGKSVTDEVKFHESLWDGDFDRALSSAKDVLASLVDGNDLKGYSALWYYLAGSAAYQAKKQKVARENFSRASSCVGALPWLKEIQDILSDQVHEVPIDADYGQHIEAIEGVFERFGTSNSLKIEKFFQAIRSGLSSADAKKFEQAQVDLGYLIGFESKNAEGSGDPDPWWILGRQGIVFEDYTGIQDNSVISKKKIRQAKGHPDTLASKYPDVVFSVVFCSPSHQLGDGAVPHVNDVYYISVEDFKEFADDCIGVIRDLWDAYSHAGDIEWRELAARKLEEKALGSDKIMERLTSRKLSSLIDG